MIKYKVFVFKQKIEKALTELNKYSYLELIGVIIYKIILDFAYLVFIQPYVTAAYKTDFNILRYILGFTFVTILYFIIKQIKNNFSSFFIKLFYCLMFIPITTVFSGKDYSILNYALFFMEFVLLSLTICIFERKTSETQKKERKRASKKSKIISIISKIIYYGFIANTLIVLISCIYFNGLPTLKAINLKNVYEVRANFQLPKPFNYLYNFEIKFILTFLLILYLHKKDYLKLGLIILIQLFIFLIKGDRIVLLSIPLALGTYYVFKLYKYCKMEKLIAPTFGVMTAFSVIIYHLYNLGYSIFVNRLLILPAHLKFMYLDFFETNPKIHIVGTIFNTILKIPNPYAEYPYQNMIGELYFNKGTMYANTGFLAEGFARIGYIGLIILPIILGIIIFMISKKTSKMDASFLAAIAIMPLFNLNDAYLLSSLTTGGILLLILVAILFDEKMIDTKYIGNVLRQKFIKRKENEEI